jgi:septum formation protein
VPLILASGSPRRAELLTAAGFTFEIVPADIDETPVAGEPAVDYALRMARAKAARVAAARSSSGERLAASGQRPAVGDVILAADTVVVGNGRLMGKPTDRQDAASMLRTLSGGTHDVHTAVVVRGPQRQAEELVTTRVRFQALSDAEIVWYLDTGEPEGKAGAYGIQGRASRFIEWIEGSWSNVVGLPISTVYRLLKAVEDGTPGRF